MRWGCRLGDEQSYCRCSKWPSLQSRSQSSICWSSPPPSGGYRSTLDIQLISRFRLRLEFMVLFQHGAPGVIVQPSKGFKSGEFGATYSSQWTSSSLSIEIHLWYNFRPISSFHVTLLTDRQTDRHKDRQTERKADKRLIEHNLLWEVMNT